LTPSETARYVFNPFALPTLAAALSLLALSVFALLRERGTQTARAFALVSGLAAATFFCFVFVRSANAEAVALSWAKSAHWFLPFVPAAFNQFLLALTGGEHRRRRLSRFCWAAALVFAVLMGGSDLTFRSVARHFWGFQPRYEWASVFFVAGFLALSGVAFEHGLREYREAAPGWHRDRLRAFLVAFAVGYLCILDFGASLGAPLYPLGFLPVLGFVALAGRAVLRYRLLDATPEYAAAQIIATMPDAVIAYDAKNRIRFANPAACALLELDESALQALPVEALIDGRSESDAALREALSRAAPLTVQGGLRSRRGERIDVRLSVSPLRAPDGSPAGAVLVAEDIRHLRAAEEAAERALRLAESRFRALAEAGSALVFMFQGGRLTYVSPSLLELTGRTEAELTRLCYWELAPEQARERLRSRGHACLQGETPLRFLTAFQTPGGGHVDVDLSLARLPSDGKPCGIGLAFDVSERRAAEQALLDSEQRVRSLLESGHLLSVLLDREGRISHASEALREFVGAPMQGLEGQDFFSFAPEDDREAARRAFRAAIRSEDLPAHEFGELLAAGGERRRIAWYSGLLRDASGEAAGAALIGFDVTRKQAAEAQDTPLAYQDPLTGLANRAQLLNRLVGCFEAARGRPHYRFALLFGDLDRFKLVNESLGHSAGDKLLIELARRLETCVRQGDVVARVGADEFALLLDDIGEAEVARRTADRIHRVLERPFAAGDGGELYLTMSIGIALNRTRYRAPEDLLRDAETAMFSGRRVGRARSREFETGMHSQVLGQLQIESDLRRALERNELRLVYQPVVSVSTGEVCAFEALLRWTRDGTPVSPERFIGVAEDSGLILTIGRWALETACQQLKRWQDRFGLERGLQINVNVSARQFEQDDFGAVVAQALLASEAAAQGLKLEITESVIMAEPEAANAQLLRLRERGVGICLDDFGTGYSSLSYLTRLPAEILKIDQSFVHRLSEGAEQEEMVRAIVGLAHGLKMEVIAEGVETREQLERLRALDCEYVQGFYLARAMEASAAEELLASRRLLPPGLRSLPGGRL
jgi:diguanylate cyclase (GGDEF)-like protein/PAS domain S-box-containing protein